MGSMTPTQTLGFSMGTSAISQIGSTYSQATSGKLESDYRRSQLQLNKQMAEIQAEDSIKRGKREAEIVRGKTKKLIGSQRAALAAQGIDISSGSAADVQADTAAMGAVDELTIKNNAFREAYGFRVQATNLGSQARYQDMAGKFNQRMTVLTGGAQFASGAFKDYAQYSRDTR